MAQWEYISEQFPSQVEPISFIRNKVDVADFIVPFKGQFAGKSYDAPFPPRVEFPNNPICSQCEGFISSTIIDRFKTGSLIFWGKVGEVQPPHLVMPITVEPTKPRMCHDERFLNLWIKDCPFSLDYLSDLPRYVGPGHFQTVCDDKSGYDHICLSPSSRTFFGLSWKDCYFIYNTFPFGWKARAYVYMFITPLVCWRIVILELWACPARNTSTIAMQASLWCVGNQPLQFGLILNWPKPLLLFSFQFSLIRSRCQNRLLSHPNASVSWVTSQILF